MFTLKIGPISLIVGGKYKRFTNIFTTGLRKFLCSILELITILGQRSNSFRGFILMTVIQSDSCVLKSCLTKF
jgi:hypothetical protein